MTEIKKIEIKKDMSNEEILEALSLIKDCLMFKAIGTYNDEGIAITDIWKVHTLIHDATDQWKKAIGKEE